MKRLVVLASLALALSATIAEAGPVSRINDAGRALFDGSNATEGTVMAFEPVSEDSRQTAVLVIDTEVQLALGCYIVPAGDQRRFHRRVEVGSTFEARSFVAGSVAIGEMTCYIVDRWDSDKKGDGTREILTGPRGFLGPVMAYAMRGKPKAAAHFFPGGVQFAGVVHELPQVIEILASFGHDLSEVRGAIDRYGAKAEEPDGSLTCRAVLVQAEDALRDFEPIADSIAEAPRGAGHHGETEAFRRASEVLRLIAEYFADPADSSVAR